VIVEFKQKQQSNRDSEENSKRTCVYFIKSTRN